jgi:hypothetical protein
MTNSGASGGRIFRPSAFRMFLFFVVLSLPLFLGTVLIRYGTGFQWRALLFGAGSIVPTSIIVAGIMHLLFPVRVTTAGIHSHSAWGLPCFIRWQDIKSARIFNLPILPWLRLYPSDGSTVVWLIMFPSTPTQYKLEIQKLAPPGNPILNHFE